MTPLRRIIVLLLLLGVSLESIAQVIPQTFSGKVTSVKDGDTIEVLYQGNPVRIRLAHVDTPEKGQPYGNNAKQFASDFCFNRVVKIVQTDKPDRYGRLIALVQIDGRTLNLELVRAGLAWHFLKYSKDQTYAGAEIDARTKKIGLWSQPNPISPWDWRAASRR
jgi:endonuclease YncB( thermonuclease family)